MVITETRLTKKVIADEEGAGLVLKLTKRVTADEERTRFMMPRIVVEKSLEVEREDSTFCLRILKLTDTLEVRDTRCLHRMEKRQNHVTMLPNASRNDY